MVSTLNTTKTCTEAENELRLSCLLSQINRGEH
jgi:hypothetical protein